MPKVPPEVKQIHRIRGWCRMRSISLGELSFQALTIYREQNPQDKKTSIYSFSGLLFLNTKRYELLDIIEDARSSLVPLKRVS